MFPNPAWKENQTDVKVSRISVILYPEPALDQHQETLYGRQFTLSGLEFLVLLVLLSFSLVLVSWDSGPLCPRVFLTQTGHLIPWPKPCLASRLRPYTWCCTWRSIMSFLALLLLRRSFSTPQFQGINSLAFLPLYGPALSTVCGHWEDAYYTALTIQTFVSSVVSLLFITLKSLILTRRFSDILYHMLLWGKD